MKALSVQGGISLTSVPEAELREGDVRVRVRVSALTSLDLEVADGAIPHRGAPGTAFVGIVEDGRGAGRKLVGRRVVARGLYGCGTCDACQAGAEWRCPDRVRPGCYGAPGGHAEAVVLPARAVTVAPQSVSDEAAAVAPLVAGVYSAIPRGALPTWTNVLVIGDGAMGLLAALAFSSAGYTVTVRGKHGHCFDLLRRHGIHFNLASDDAEVSGDRPGRFGPALASYPYVVEASGHPSGWLAASRLATRGGTIFMLTSCTDGELRPLTALQEKSLRVVGMRDGPVEAVLGILGQGLFDPTEVVTRTFSFEEAVEAYAKARAPRQWLVLLRMAR